MAQTAAITITNVSVIKTGEKDGRKWTLRKVSVKEHIAPDFPGHFTTFDPGFASFEPGEMRMVEYTVRQNGKYIDYQIVTPRAERAKKDDANGVAVAQFDARLANIERRLDAILDVLKVRA